MQEQNISCKNEFNLPPNSNIISNNLLHIICGQYKIPQADTHSMPSPRSELFFICINIL